MKEKRLKFAESRKEWTVEDWKQVLWSDEAPFQLFNTPNRQNDRACIHHFREEDIERNIEYYNGVEMIKMPGKKVVPKKFAVLSIFPNCPTYFTDAVAKTQRLSLDDKEEKRMQDVHKKSRAEFQQTKAKFMISSLSCITSKLHMIELPNGWLFHRPDSSNILFLKIQFCDEVSTIE
ncbi:hypothetical protein LOD99_5255 [Oopsacas minuta]|uniref:THAP-type domain-containing protein n=1 Tax=Oopsacas minuta TaxID=111878 RepID=A0AAV7JR38_9METZ|nr:hypothetical protein LOD99_5255 [Oopsacas minuta]